MLASSHSPIVAAGVISQPNTGPFSKSNVIIHGDNNSGNNHVFIDSSQYNKTLTRVGMATQTPLSPFGNNWSYYCRYNTLTTSSGYAISSGPFTLEFFLKVNSGITSRQHFVASTSGSNMFLIGWSGTQYIARFNSASDVGFGGSLTPGEWVHVALVRDSSNNCKLYVAGKQIGNATTYAGAVGYSNNFGVGGNTTNTMSGLISNIRFGSTAEYLAEFTPPTSPLSVIAGTTLLAASKNRMMNVVSPSHVFSDWNGSPLVSSDSPFPQTAAYDASTNGASVYFANQSSITSYVEVPSSADNTFTGDFCIEGWMLQETRGSDGIVFELGNGNGGDGILFRVGASGAYDTIRFLGTTVLASSQYLILNQWNHFAVARLGGVVSIYINGTRQYTATNSTTVNASGNILRIGSAVHTSGQGFNGYISNFRVLKGTCPYSGATLTVPTAPFTDTGTDTKLLCLFKNARTINTTSRGLVLSNVHATPIAIDASTAKIGSGAINLAATTGITVKATHPTLKIGGVINKNFTVEAWFRPGATVNDCRLITTKSNASGYSYFSLRISNGTLAIWATSSPVSWNFWDSANVGFTPTANQWFHVALVKSGTTLKLFVDGTLKLTRLGVDFGEIDEVFTSSDLWLGASGDPGTAGNALNGHMDEFNFVSYAKYSDNFTPPTTPAPDV